MNGSTPLSRFGVDTESYILNLGKVLMFMKNTKLAWRGFLNAIGVVAYVSCVALIMQNGEKIFGKMHNLLGPVSFLLLFVLSAAITGGLVLVKPAMLYFENCKSEAVRLFLYTIGWIFVATSSALAVQVFII